MVKITHAVQSNLKCVNWNNTKHFSGDAKCYKHKYFSCSLGGTEVLKYPLYLLPTSSTQTKLLYIYKRRDGDWVVSLEGMSAEIPQRCGTYTLSCSEGACQAPIKEVPLRRGITCKHEGKGPYSTNTIRKRANLLSYTFNNAWCFMDHSCGYLSPLHFTAPLCCGAETMERIKMDEGV